MTPPPITKKSYIVVASLFMLNNDGLDGEMPIHDMETIMMLVWSRLLNRLDSSKLILSSFSET